jgi:hypothetical protein
VTESEADRLDLYNRLQEVLGTSPATTLMSNLAASGDLVTTTEFADFKTEMRRFVAEMCEFKIEMREFKIEMREFKADMHRSLTEVNRFIDGVLLAVVTGQFVLLAAIVSAAAWL